jgi:hypothetical protein
VEQKEGKAEKSYGGDRREVRSRLDRLGEEKVLVTRECTGLSEVLFTGYFMIGFARLECHSTQDANPTSNLHFAVMYSPVVEEKLSPPTFLMLTRRSYQAVVRQAVALILGGSSITKL